MSASPWLTGNASRPTRVKLQMALTILSLGLLIYSLFLPAVRTPHDPADDGNMPVAGFACAMVSRPHYPSNLFCLAVPLICARLRRGRRAGPQLTFAVIAVASLAFVALTPIFPPAAQAFFGKSLVFDVGFSVWVAAHALAAAALLIPVWGVDIDRRDADAAYARLQERWAAPTQPRPTPEVSRSQHRTTARMPPRKHPSFFDDAARRDRARLQVALTICSLLLWAWSLFLPAVRTSESRNPEKSPVPGIFCAVMSVAHYPANLYLLAGPLLCWAARRGQHAQPQMTLAAIAVLFTLHAAATPFIPLWPYQNEAWAHDIDADSGFLVWLTAHVLATTALLLPVWGIDPARREADQAYANLRKRWLSNTAKPTR
jgi:hypothetical protein